MDTRVRVEKYEQSKFEMRKRVNVITSGRVNLRRESLLKGTIELVIQTMTIVSVKAITRNRVVNVYSSRYEIIVKPRAEQAPSTSSL